MVLKETGAGGIRHRKQAETRRETEGPDIGREGMEETSAYRLPKDNRISLLPGFDRLSGVFVFLIRSLHDEDRAE